MRNRAHHLLRVWALTVALILLALGLPGAGRHTCKADDFSSGRTVVETCHVCAACSLAVAERSEPPASGVRYVRPGLTTAPVRTISLPFILPSFPVTVRAPPPVS